MCFRAASSAPRACRQERGGKLLVVDPRRTETARLADEHLFIRPGTDAPFLLAIVHTLFDEGIVDLGAAEGLVAGLDAVEKAARAYAPERVAERCGVDAATTRRLARELAAAPAAACYGRLGTCVQEFGTLASWGCDLVNILTGNLDRPGGVMFANPAAPIDAALPKGVGFEIGRWRSRVSGRPEVGGLIPSSTMAEEILTPGDGQVRAMFLLMTNPLRSAANSTQLERAFAQLDLLVAVDFYINETTRHADFILPLGPLEPGLRRIQHRGGRARLAAAPLVEALRAFLADLRSQPAANGELLLIGRRELRTCNSWIHNAPSMVSGRERCLLYVHPEDAARAGLADGDMACLDSKAHSGQVKVHVTDEIRPGVVSLPHGWGHAETAPWQSVASAHPGVSANDWTDDQDVESVVGQSILNGVPVRLSAA
jgi:anaerobic selenocysteine-containing dehydrogenase